jgi:hypothetical protein
VHYLAAMQVHSTSYGDRARSAEWKFRAVAYLETGAPLPRPSTLVIMADPPKRPPISRESVIGDAELHHERRVDRLVVREPPAQQPRVGEEDVVAAVFLLVVVQA